MKNLIVAVFIGLAGVNNAMAQETEFTLPDLTSTLQTQIDEKMAASLHRKTLLFSKTNYLAQEQVKTSKAS